jgi:hypothetical protein
VTALDRVTPGDLSPWRTGVITGSRIAKVLDCSTFGGPDDVLREMVREHFGAEPEFTGNMITDFGQEHEPAAIKLYERETGYWTYATGEDQRFIPHPTIHWLGVTPDGLIGGDGMVEVKVPWRAKYVHISQRPGYEVQIRLQLECAQREWCDFAVYRPDLPPESQLWLSQVQHDPAWLPSVMPKLQAFMDRYHAIIADEAKAQPYLEPLQDVRDDIEWIEAAATYQEALATLRAAEADLVEPRQRLIDLSNGKTSVGFGIRVQHSERKGSIDYKALSAKHAPDADPEDFRKDPTPVVSVNLTGGRK